MDYHSHRFSDVSAMVYKDDKLVCCFPANKNGNSVFSHQGLTYGGFILSSETKIKDSEEIIEALTEFYAKSEITEIYIKLVPEIYHKQPSSDVHYWLWRKNAERYRIDTTFTVDLSKKLIFSERKRRYAKKAKAAKYSVCYTENPSLFWEEILIPNLNERYRTSPAHNCAEISMLTKRFPANIKHYEVMNMYNKIVAGTTLFITEQVVHAQYIAANDEGKKNGASDFLFTYLLDHYQQQKFRYFDFGISNENSGNTLNYSLAAYKEGFGANVFLHEFYKLKL